MRLEQTVKVLLNALDFKTMYEGAPLTVTCGCGQQILLVWERGARLTSAIHGALRRAGAPPVAEEPTPPVAPAPDAPPSAPSKGNGTAQVAPAFPCTWAGCPQGFTTANGLRMHVMRVHHHKGPQRQFQIGDKVRYIGNRNAAYRGKVAEVRGHQKLRGFWLRYPDGHAGAALPASLELVS